MKKYIHDEGSFEGIGGLKIYFQLFKASKYNTVIIIAHGAGEHSGRYTFPIEYFVDKGIAFYGLDHRGNGRSEGRRGHIGKFSNYIEDLKSFVDIVKKREGEKRYFLLGNSMGGLIALRYIEKYPKGIDGLIITSPLLKVEEETSKYKLTIREMLSKYLPKFLMTNEVDPYYLSQDREVVKKYINDKLAHNKVSARWLTEIITAVNEAHGEAGDIKTPILLMHAGADKVVPVDGSREFFDKIGSEDKDLIIYRGAYHEIMNDIGRDNVFKDIEKWLKPRIKR
jgi:alpha-beta hydrolase superfamily lysophospholipase